MAGYTREGNQRGLAQTHFNVGLSFRDLGYAADADAHYRRAIDFAAATQTDDVLALAETERAYLRARSGDGELAENLARRALDRFEEIGDPNGRAQATFVLAAAARARGDDALAEERLRTAMALAVAHEDVLLQAEVQRDFGFLFRDQGRFGEARDAFAEAVESYARIGSAAEAEALRTILSELPDSGE
jgi:tetratricopeptide (TPR) repeat protein